MNHTPTCAVTVAAYSRAVKVEQGSRRGNVGLAAHDPCPHGKQKPWLGRTCRCLGSHCTKAALCPTGREMALRASLECAAGPDTAEEAKPCLPAVYPMPRSYATLLSERMLTTEATMRYIRSPRGSGDLFGSGTLGSSAWDGLRSRVTSSRASTTSGKTWLRQVRFLFAPNPGDLHPQVVGDLPKVLHG